MNDYVQSGLMIIVLNTRASHYLCLQRFCPSTGQSGRAASLKKKKESRIIDFMLLSFFLKQICADMCVLTGF